MPTPRTRGHKVPTEGTEIEAAKVEESPKKTYCLYRKDGEILFKSDIPQADLFYRTEREQDFAKNLRAILGAALDADIDPREIFISGMNLANCDLQHLCLAGITITNCQLNRADMRGTYLREANLEGCTFNGARLHGADLTDANIDDTDLSDVEAGWIGGVINLGELDGWKVYGYKDSDGYLRVRAGCRNFTLPEAREHWEDRKDDDRQEIWAALNLLEVVARRRGWKVTNEDPGVQEVKEEEFEVKEDEDDDE